MFATNFASSRHVPMGHAAFHKHFMGNAIALQPIAPPSGLSLKLIKSITSFSSATCYFWTNANFIVIHTISDLQQQLPQGGILKFVNVGFKWTRNALSFTPTVYLAMTQLSQYNVNGNQRIKGFLPETYTYMPTLLSTGNTINVGTNSSCTFPNTWAHFSACNQLYIGVYSDGTGTGTSGNQSTFTLTGRIEVWAFSIA